MRLPAGDKEEGKIAARIFAVLAAFFLVGSAAVASMLPPDLSLYDCLRLLDPERAEAAQAAFITHVGRQAWNAVMIPILLRPPWLVPFCLGILFAGGGLSFSFHAAPRPRRWHS